MRTDLRIEGLLWFCYNEGPHLAETLTSCDTQRYLVYEIVLDEVSLENALNVVGTASLTGRTGAHGDARFGAAHVVAYPTAQLL